MRDFLKPSPKHCRIIRIKKIVTDGVNSSLSYAVNKKARESRIEGIIKRIEREQREAIRRLDKTGLKASAIAERVGCSLKEVKDELSKNL